jgi:hypothetical protein
MRGDLGKFKPLELLKNGLASIRIGRFSNIKDRCSNVLNHLFIHPKAKRFVLVFSAITLIFVMLIGTNVLLQIPTSSQRANAAGSANITKTSTGDFNQGTNSNINTAGNEAKLAQSSGWADNSYPYREQLNVTAQPGSAISKGHTLNAAGVGSGTFDGSGDWFDLGDNFNSMTFPMTVESWVKVDGNNIPGTIFTSDDNLESKYAGFYLFYEPSADTSKYVIDAEVGDNVGEGSNNRSRKTSTATFNANTWAHVAAVFNAVGNYTLYINGVDAGGSYSGTGTTMAHSAKPARIGRRAINPDFSIDYQAKGNIDEVRIWSKARTLADMQADMYKEIAPQANLEGYYTFDQSSGTLLDMSGHNINGTAAGDANYSPYANVWGGINTKALVDAGKMRSDGNDLRLFYGSNEIERELIPATGKTLATSEATQVLFKSQAAIGAGGSDNGYYLYYGNPGATDPIVNVYNKKFRTKNAYITPFDGSGANYLQYNSDNFPTGGDGTMEFWYKYSNAGSSHNETGSLFAGEDTQNVWSIWNNRWGYRNYAKVGGVDVIPSDPGNINDGRDWNHTVLTWHNTDTNSVVKMYENNVMTADVENGAKITSWPSYMKFLDASSSYDGIEMGLLAVFNTAKDSTWVSSEYNRSTSMPIVSGSRDASATFIQNFDGSGLDATADNGGYASGTTTAVNQGTIISGDYRQGDTSDERVGNSWVSGVYNWFDNFDTTSAKSPGVDEFGKINVVSNELVLKNGQQAIINKQSATMPTNYRVDVSAKGTQPELLFNHQDKVGWWANSVCAANVTNPGIESSDLLFPRDAATGFLSSNSSKYYLSVWNGYTPKYLQFDLATNGNYSGVVWQYWNGSNWISFTPAADGTANFSKSGIVDISNINASFGPNAPTDGDCTWGGNLNVIKITASTVTSAATLNQINKIYDFAKSSFSATSNTLSGDTNGATGTATISRSTAAYDQLGLRRVGTGLQSFNDSRQTINTTTTSSMDSNLLGLSATTDATFDNLKIYKAVTSEPSVAQLVEKTVYPVSEATAWYNSAWSNRQKVTIDHTKVPNTDQPDFPVLIKIDDQTNKLFTGAQADGDDILFTNSNGTSKLSHEIETFSTLSGSKSLVAWVKVPNLSHTVDTVLYLYYGNGDVSSQQNKTDVWSGYAMSQHLTDATTATVADSKNVYPGNKSSANNPNQSDAKIFKGQDFTGDTIDFGDLTALNSASKFTISGWVNSNNYGVFGAIFSKEAQYSYNNDLLLYQDSNSLCLQVDNGGDGGGSFATNGVMTAGNWYLLTAVFDGTQSGNANRMKIYLNGSMETLAFGSYSVPATSANLPGVSAKAGSYDNSSSFSGKLDEFRVSSNAYSGDWALTEYNNQNNPSAFSSFSAEESNVFYTSPTSVTAGSGILNTNWNGGWGTPSGFTANVVIPTNTSIVFKVRSSAVGGANDADWTSWASVGTATQSGQFSVATASMPNITLGKNKYLQIWALLTSSDGLNTPILQDYSIYYVPDPDPPSTPTLSSLTVAGTPVVSGNWATNPGVLLANFGGSVDPDNLSGVAGYYLYLGDSSSADPQISGVYQSHVGAQADAQTFSSSVSSSDDGKYFYLIVKAVDGAGNVSTSSTLSQFGLDTILPTQPSFVAATPAGYTTTNSFSFNWPAAIDPAGPAGQSGLKWYQYKRATDPSWSHTADASTRTVANIQAYQEGANAFYVRSVDNAGNTSSSYQQVTYYWSGTAPAKPNNLVVDPGASDSNSFSFSFDKPAVASGDPAIVGYYYSINEAPTVSNVTYVGSTDGHITVGPQAFATIQGVNTVYVLSVNTAGNLSYESGYVSSQTFNCQTPAPPIPTSVSLTDPSDRATNRWMLALQWVSGTGHNPATFSHYKIERAIDGLNFSELATTGGTAYIDTAGLSSEHTYYYQIREVDNAGKESAPSSIVHKQPAGKYTAPPTILAEPTASSLKSTSATISWTTDRNSSSIIRYGTKADSFSASTGTLDLKTNHAVSVLGLTPNTLYYYQAQSLDEDRDYSPDAAYSATYSFTTGAAPAISETKVDNIALTSADISFATTTVATSIINFGTSNSYGTKVEDISGAQATNHNVKLTNLVPGTTYHFKIQGTDIENNILSSDDYQFDTLPLPHVDNLKVEAIPGKPQSAFKASWTTNVPTTTILKYKTGSDQFQESVKSKSETEHSVEVNDLQDSSDYQIVASGRDSLGNLAESPIAKFTTPLDTRPPVIAEVQIETSNIGSDNVNLAQVAISWQTDEAATGKVEYGQNSEGAFTGSSKEDLSLTKEHTVIISDLDPTKPYHLKVVSRDKAGNSAESPNQTFVTAEAKKSVWGMIMTTLQNIFGFINIGN